MHHAASSSTGSQVPLRPGARSRIWIEEAQARGGDDATDMAPADGPSALLLLNLASTTYRIATGPQAGRRIARIGGGVRAPGGGEQAALGRDRRLHPARGEELPDR
jgi:hypothetical protein